MDNQLQVFSNPEFGKVRMVVVKDKPYAVASDIAKTLGYSIPHKAVRDNCKGVLTWNIPTNGGKQKALIIPEGDIYRLIVKAADQSKSLKIKDKAARFERWVFDEVIPSIRKHGAYMTDSVLDEVISDPDFGIRLLTELKKEKEKIKQLELQNEQNNQLIGKLEPKANKYDAFLDADGTITFTTMGKHFLGGMTAIRVRKWLQAKGVLYNRKVDGAWQPKVGYEEYFKTFPYVKSGYIQTFITKITPKGIDFILSVV